MEERKHLRKSLVDDRDFYERKHLRKSLVDDGGKKKENIYVKVLSMIGGKKTFTFLVEKSLVDDGQDFYVNVFFPPSSTRHLRKVLSSGGKKTFL